MSTPGQTVIGLIRELRAMGVKYNQLMQERDVVTDGGEGRSEESIDKEIDELLDVTMATASLLAREQTTKKLTVFGFHTDTGLITNTVVETESFTDAIQHVADLNPDISITIVAVVEGEHKSLMEAEYIEDTDDLEPERKPDDKTSG